MGKKRKQKAIDENQKASDCAVHEETEKLETPTSQKSTKKQKLSHQSIATNSVPSKRNHTTETLEEDESGATNGDGSGAMNGDGSGATNSDGSGATDSDGSGATTDNNELKESTENDKSSSESPTKKDSESFFSQIAFSELPVCDPIKTALAEMKMKTLTEIQV